MVGARRWGGRGGRSEKKGGGEERAGWRLQLRARPGPARRVEAGRRRGGAGEKKRGAGGAKKRLAAGRLSQQKGHAALIFVF